MFQLRKHGYFPTKQYNSNEQAYFPKPSGRSASTLDLSASALDLSTSAFDLSFNMFGLC